MKKTEIKSSVRKALHAEIPNYDRWRAFVRLHEETGVMPDGFSTFCAAYIDYNTETGECKNITTYSYGDGMMRRHSDGWDGTMDVTDIFLDWMRNAHYEEDSRKRRNAVIDKITDAIIEATEEAKEN